VKVASAGAAILCLLVSATTAANLVDDINKVRRKGCGGRPGVTTELRVNRELDAVAREWSRGGRLREALARTGYRAVNSASMRVEGAPNDAALVKVLEDRYCDTLTDPAFTAIGMSRQPKEVHIVVALPFAVPSASEAATIGQRVLQLVNEARARPRKCGGNEYPAAPPVTLSATLTRAALTHAQDMAQHNFFEHEGSDGSTAAARATRAGYEWKNVAENIAAGATTPEAVVSGWLGSPGHCANMMGARFAEMGIAYATNSKSDAGIYWAQVLGKR
jgi:uncharacterized protein YkwD